MLITKWEKEDRQFRKQNAGKTTYSVTDLDGDRYFQIQSYGTATRKTPGMASQTLQFNREQAVELIKILVEEFELE